MQRDFREAFDALLGGRAPMLALAPMQGVTDLPFLRLMAGYGGADVYVTEYFRVYATSRLDSTSSSLSTRIPQAGPSSRR